MVSSSSPKVQDDDEVAKRLKSKKANLKKTGKTMTKKILLATLLVWAFGAAADIAKMADEIEKKLSKDIWVGG